MGDSINTASDYHIHQALLDGHHLNNSKGCEDTDYALYCRETNSPEEPPERWCALFQLVIAVWLGTSTWLSTSAVLPQLLVIYDVSESKGSLLSVFVNVGFLFGALISSAIGAADILETKHLLAVGSLAAAIFNAMLLIPGCNYSTALCLRFAGGVAMAFVYPVGCKHVSTWFLSGRGVGLGTVIGAVVFGSASPHLIGVVIKGAPHWRIVVSICSIAGAFGALISICFLQAGPFLPSKKCLRVRVSNVTNEDIVSGTINESTNINDNNDMTEENTTSIKYQSIVEYFRNHEVLLATLAYCGHNWELFGMWVYYKKFALASITAYNDVHGRTNPEEGNWKLVSEDPNQNACMIAFVTISIGAFGCVICGHFADVCNPNPNFFQFFI